jgi:hypothetical protein
VALILVVIAAACTNEAGIQEVNVHSNDSLEPATSVYIAEGSGLDSKLTPIKRETNFND